MNIFEPLNKILIFYFKGEFCFRFHLNLILKWLKLLSWQLNFFFFHSSWTSDSLSIFWQLPSLSSQSKNFLCFGI